MCRLDVYGLEGRELIRIAEMRVVMESGEVEY